jgi:ArsR family transcriptional regulator
MLKILQGSEVAREVASDAVVGALRALGDEKRLRIVALLSEGQLCVCDLAVRVDMKQPLLSFHLKTLREAGLVLATRRGKWIYYSLNDEALGYLADVLSRTGEAAAEAAARDADACC